MLAALKRSVRDAVANLGLASPAYRFYSAISRANPKVISANARYRRHGAPDGLPIPPPELIFLVAGSSDISWFLNAGALAAKSIAETLRKNGVAIENLDAILDFGCGSGRVVRNWRSLHGPAVFGTDYNPRLIEWCRAHLPFAHFSANQLAPPLAFDDSSFDLVYALSVFTHLTPDLQASWARELARVIKPGGHLVVSTHGDAYIHRLNDAERKEFTAGQLVVKNNTRTPGENTCAAYHPLAYVRDHLIRDEFALIDFVPEGAKGNPRQDLYLLRKPHFSAARS